MKAKRSVGSAAALLSSVFLLAAAPLIAQRMSSAPHAAAIHAGPPATHVVAHPVASRRVAPAVAGPSAGVRASASVAAFRRRFPRGPHFAGPGFYLLDGGAYYPFFDNPNTDEPDAVAAAADQSGEQQQPQVMLGQQQEQSAPPNSVETAAASEPLPDVGQFTIVLQNGQRLQAIAFTRANDKIVYITADGFRGSIAIADINTDATKQINADRGTPIQLPL